MNRRSYIVNCTVKLSIDLDPMDLKANHTPLLTDTATLTRTRSRLGVTSSLLPCSPTATAAATFPHGPLLAIPRKKTGVLDDVRSNGWLDAMKSSSPTHKKISKEVVGHGVTSSDTDAAYFTWLV